MVKYILSLATALVIGLSGIAFADGFEVGHPSSWTGAGSAAQAISTNTQQQGQSISGSGNSSVGNSGNSNVSFSDSFNGADPIRYLPIPTNVNVSTAGGPQIFGSPDYADRGPHFMSMLVLVSAMNNIDLNEVSANDSGDIQTVVQEINLLSQEERDAYNNQRFQFLLNKDADVTSTIPDFNTVAVVTMKADDDDTINSASLAVRLAEIADEYGAKKIVIISEGTSKRISSWGVGIGFSYNMAKVGSDHNDQGTVGAGGFGWSYGEGEYFSLPYLTAVIGN